MRLASVLRFGGALARRGGRRAAVRRGEAPPPAGGTARLAPRAAVLSSNATAVAMFAAETAVAVWDASTRERCGRARAMSQLAHLFEGGRQPRGRARAVHGEGRRPSDGRLRRESAGADGQQCERGGTHGAFLPPPSLQSSNVCTSGLPTSPVRETKAFYTHPTTTPRRRRSSSL